MALNSLYKFLLYLFKSNLTKYTQQQVISMWAYLVLFVYLIIIFYVYPSKFIAECAILKIGQHVLKLLYMNS